MSWDDTLEKVFNDVDADVNGQVDKKELKPVVEAIGEQMALSPRSVAATGTRSAANGKLSLLRDDIVQPDIVKILTILISGWAAPYRNKNSLP